MNSVKIYITEAQKKRIDALPRSVNLSDKLRNLLDNVLDAIEKEKKDTKDR